MATKHIKSNIPNDPNWNTLSLTDQFKILLQLYIDGLKDQYGFGWHHHVGEALLNQEFVAGERFIEFEVDMVSSEWKC